MNISNVLLPAAWVVAASAVMYFQPTPLALLSVLSSAPYATAVLTGRRVLIAVAVALQLPALIDYSAHATSILWGCAILTLLIYLAEIGDLVARSKSCLDRGYVRRRARELTGLACSSLALTILLLHAALPVAGLGVDFSELAALLLLLMILASLLFSAGEK